MQNDVGAMMEELLLKTLPPVEEKGKGKKGEGKSSEAKKAEGEKKGADK